MEVIGEAYKATEKYGEAFWDVAGGNFDKIASLGENFAGMYAINETFGKAFQGNDPAQAAGSQVGQGLGYTVAGPFGAIVGGMFGSMAGDILGGIFGWNTEPDYNYMISSGKGGFEDNNYFSTPFGNVGFQAAGTRDLSGNQGKGMLRAFQKVIQPMDVALASVMTKDEVGQVKAAIEGSRVSNAHEMAPQDILRDMTFSRLKAIDSTMSTARKEETGFNEQITKWNNSFTGPTDEDAQLATDVYAKQKDAASAYENADNLWNDKERIEYAAAKSEWDTFKNKNSWVANEYNDWNNQDINYRSIDFKSAARAETKKQARYLI